MGMIGLMVGAMLAAMMQAAAPRPLEPPLGSARGEQDPDRPQLSAADLKSLRENNIFSPARPKRHKPAPPPPAPSKRLPPKPKAPVVTGIFFDTTARAHVALVEDKNPAPSSVKDPDLRQFKGPQFLKAGDELLGCRIDSISGDKLVLSQGEEVKELKVGDSFPESCVKIPEGLAPPEASEEQAETKGEPGSQPKVESKADAKSLDESLQKDVLKMLKDKNKGKKRNYDDEQR